jgi:RNA polymerase sigma factor (sigma-70 family)
MSAALSVVPPAAESAVRVSGMSRERAVAEFDHLIGPIARRLVGGGSDLDDLMQEGRIGLLVAADKWDSERSFPAFASVCIQNSVRAAAKRARARARWGLSSSIDQPFDEDGASLHDVLGETGAQEEHSAVARLRYEISELPARERDILNAHADGCTFAEIGRRMNLTGSRVRAIAVETVEKMIVRLAPQLAPPRVVVKAPPKKYVARGPCQRITHNGRTLTKMQWARQSGISYTAFCRRLDEGWSMERALSTPAVIGRPPRRSHSEDARRIMAEADCDFRTARKAILHGAGAIRGSLSGRIADAAKRLGIALGASGDQKETP